MLLPPLLSPWLQRCHHQPRPKLQLWHNIAPVRLQQPHLEPTAAATTANNISLVPVPLAHVNYVAELPADGLWLYPAGKWLDRPHRPRYQQSATWPAATAPSPLASWLSSSFFNGFYVTSTWNGSTNRACWMRAHSINTNQSRWCTVPATRRAAATGMEQCQCTIEGRI